MTKGKAGVEYRLSEDRATLTKVLRGESYRATFVRVVVVVRGRLAGVDLNIRGLILMKLVLMKSSPGRKL